MPRRNEYVPKHRGPAAEPVLKKRIRKSLLYSGVAVAATGLAVSSGVFAQKDAVGDSTSASLSSADDHTSDLSERTRSASRSDSRSPQADAVRDAGRRASGSKDTDATDDRVAADPRDVARAMLADFGFTEAEFSCLDALYVSESGWDPHADNPSSSAYGIPQALTGGTHDNLPADYMTNPVSQIRWGLQYIKDTYGTPCAAWEFKQSNQWY